MNVPEFLTQDADGHIHVTGHRIGLLDLVFYYDEGYSPESLFDLFPTLPLAIIHKTIAFYLENQSEVESYAALSDLETTRQRAVPQRGPDAAELRRRLAAKQGAEA